MNTENYIPQLNKIENTTTQKPEIIKPLTIVTFLIILIFVGVGSYSLGKTQSIYYKKKIERPTPLLLPSISNSSPSPLSMPKRKDFSEVINEKGKDIKYDYVAGGALADSRYKITVFPNWELSHTLNTYDGSILGDTLILAYSLNPEYKLVISSGEVQGCACIYKDDTEIEDGPICKYGDFVEISDSEDRLYRRSNDRIELPYQNELYHLCLHAKETQNYLSNTLFGGIYYEIPIDSINDKKPILSGNQEIIKQMDNMISYLTKFGY